MFTLLRGDRKAVIVCHTRLLLSIRTDDIFTLSVFRYYLYRLLVITPIFFGTNDNSSIICIINCSSVLTIYGVVQGRPSMKIQADNDNNKLKFVDTLIIDTIHNISFCFI